MTNKIIIDGIDVSKCEFLQCGNCEATRDVYGDSSYECKDDDMENCYYKQLKRKEQEYKNVSDIIRNTNVYSDIVDTCRDEILIYPSISGRTNYTDNEVDVLTLNAIIRRLEKKEQECEKKDKNIKYLSECLNKSYATQEDSEFWWEKERNKLKQQLEEKEQENNKLKEKIKAYQEDRFCQGGCVVYQYDKIHKLKQALNEIEEYIEIEDWSILGYVQRGILNIINKARKE